LLSPLAGLGVNYGATPALTRWANEFRRRMAAWAGLIAVPELSSSCLWDSAHLAESMG